MSVGLGSLLMRLVIVYGVSEKRTDFETVQLEIIRIDFDDIWQ